MPQTRDRELRFTSVRLENWRNFGSAETPLRRRTFLVGPNACGKSNLLDALRFLRDVAAPGGGLADAVARRGGLAAIRALTAKGDAPVGLEVRLGTGPNPNLWSYRLAYGQDRHGQPRVLSENVTKAGEVLLQRPDVADAADPDRLTQTHLEQVLANQAFRDVADLLASVRYLHLVPQIVREPRRWALRDMDPFGADIVERLGECDERAIEARLRRMNEVLRLAIPQFDELELHREERTGAPRLRARFVHWRGRNAYQCDDLFSDGTLRLIGLLWALMDGTGPVLLEEPELTLHPEVARHLPRMLARAQHRIGRQAIISTHSHDILEDEGIAPDEVVLFQPRPDGTTLTPAGDVLQIRESLLSGLSIGDAVIPLTRPPEALKLSLVLD